MNLIELFSRFATVGVIATLVHLGVALLALSLGAGAQMANACGFAVAFCVGYLGHHQFTFRGRSLETLRTLLRYGLVSCASFLGGQGLLGVLVDLEFFPKAAAVLIAVGIVAALNFTFSHFWAFAASAKPIEARQVGGKNAKSY